jgi:hypothetical protein
MVETRKKTTAPKGGHAQVSTSDLPTRAPGNNHKTVQSDQSLSATKATPLDKLINLLTRVRDDGVHEHLLWISGMKSLTCTPLFDLLAFTRVDPEHFHC